MGTNTGQYQYLNTVLVLLHPYPTAFDQTLWIILIFSKYPSPDGKIEIKWYLPGTNHSTS
jgi:hypothetical protein